MAEEMREDLKRALADITEELNSLVSASNGMATAKTAGVFLLSLDRAEKSSHLLGDRYALLRQAIFNEPIKREPT